MPRGRQIDEVLRQLTNLGCDPRPSGTDRWRSRCPVHQGTSSNLSIWIGDDGIGMKCHHTGESGAPTCSYAALAAAVGLTAGDETNPKRKRGRRPKQATGRPPAEDNRKEDAAQSRPRRPAQPGHRTPALALAAIISRLGKPVAEWRYWNADATPAMNVYRFNTPDGGKEFRPVHVDTEGLWHLGDPPGPLPLYHLRGTDLAAVVFVVEGEKCADLVHRIGPHGVTSAHGSKSPGLTDWSPLADKIVILVPDKDDPGKGYVLKIAELLWALDPRPTIKILHLPVENQGDDIEQWLESLPDQWTTEQIRTELMRLAEEAPEWTPPVAEAEKPATTDAKSNRRNETNAQVLIRLAEAVTLFHDSSERGYAAIPIEGGHESVHPINSTSFARWLKRAYWIEQGFPPSTQALQDALGILDAKATFDCPEDQVFIRVGHKDGRTYLDLGDKTWAAVEIDGTGWRVVTKPPVRFRRPGAMASLPEPAQGSTIAQLGTYLNLDADELPLLVAWLAAAMRAAGPYPLLVLSGEAGTAKSTMAKAIRSLVDPHTRPLRGEPADGRDLMIGASNSWVLALDNLTTVPSWMSDLLCRIATGGAYATRTLYTDDEETFIEACRPVVITGIAELVSRGDLVDRSVFLHLPPIGDGSRKTEASYWEAFEAARPALLGALLDAVSSAMRLLPSVRISPLPRMADFALFGEAACRAAAYEPGHFAQAYLGNRSGANESALEDSPIVAALCRLARGPAWSGRSAELLEELATIAGDKAALSPRWPKGPRALSTMLRRLAPQLRQIGVHLTFDRAHGSRFVEIQGPPGEFTPEFASFAAPARNSLPGNGHVGAAKNGACGTFAAPDDGFAAPGNFAAPERPRPPY
jgi:hypothetical protein